MKTQDYWNLWHIEELEGSFRESAKKMVGALIEELEKEEEVE